MPNQAGDHIWYELMTDDADAAQEFYGAVVGWSFAGSDQPDMEYRHISINGDGVGGILALTPEMTQNGARPCWIGYVAVDDVDVTAKSIKDAGGSIHLEPRDIPGVGRIAMVADPQGAVFYIMRPTPPPGDPNATSTAFAGAVPKDGHCAWNELSTTEPVAAIEFYGAQFGWRQEGDMDMGPMGKYQFLYHGPTMMGAVMPKMPEMPKSAWSYYFRVPDIDAAVETIKAKGGSILQEPIEIPGGDFSMSGIDPQGAAFALVGARK